MAGNYSPMKLTQQQSIRLKSLYASAMAEHLLQAAHMNLPIRVVTIQHLTPTEKVSK